MIQKNKSNQKLSPIKVAQNKSLKLQQDPIKKKFYQKGTQSKQIKSNRSKSHKSLSKSKGKQQRHGKQNIDQIQKQYTKETYKRVQQRLNICTKIQDLIVQINQRQSKLKSYFEIYRILQSEAGQQRCLQHNNDLSLYCQTQNRILCVHCIYGASRHKTHKVLPLKDCIKQISKDITSLTKTVECDIETVKIKIKTSEMNQNFIERNYRNQLIELENKYNQKLHLLQADYCQRKKYLNQYFHEIIKKNSELIHSLKAFDKSVTFKLGQLKKDQHNFKNVNDAKIISKQSILAKISELTDLKGMAVQDITEKDIGQNVLRNRIKTAQIAK